MVKNELHIKLHDKIRKNIEIENIIDLCLTNIFKIVDQITYSSDAKTCIESLTKMKLHNKDETNKTIEILELLTKESQNTQQLNKATIYDFQETYH